MKYVTAFVAIVLLAIMACNINDKGQQRYIVTFTGDDSLSAQGSLKYYGLKIHKQMVSRDKYIVYMDEDQAERIGDLFEVKPDKLYYANSSCRRDDDPMPAPIPPEEQPEQETSWGWDVVEAKAANNFARGSGITVCVVDTGIDKDHLDLKDNIVGGQDFTGTGDWDDDNGHGTHVAGIIGARDNRIGVVGVAPRVGLFAAKVLGADGSGYSSDIADAIAACTVRGANIINLSLGGPEPTDILGEAIRDAHERGVIIVGSAGNEGGPVGWPAARPEVLAVSSLDDDLELSYFSSRGPEVEYAAPGGRILSTLPGSAYGSLSGTSMAAPFVSGIFALALEVDRPVEVVDLGLLQEEQGKGMPSARLTVGE